MGWFCLTSLGLRASEFGPSLPPQANKNYVNHIEIDISSGCLQGALEGTKAVSTRGIVTNIAPSVQLGLLAAASKPTGEDVRLDKERVPKEPLIMLGYFTE